MRCTKIPYDARMNSLNSLLPPKKTKLLLKHLTDSYNLTHTLTLTTSPLAIQSPTNPPPTRPSSAYSSIKDEALAKTIATQLSNSTNIQELNQIYARIIRTHLLESYPAAFHFNNIIRSYTRLNAPVKALQVYISMSRGGVLPDSYTLPILLKAVRQFFAIEIGRQLHCVATKLCLVSNEYSESGFICLYLESGELEIAYKLFEENPDRKLGSWNAIIGGLSQLGRAEETIEKFMEMMNFGFQPDDVTMVSVTSACGSVGDLNLALQLHKYVFYASSVSKANILMLNSLIDMYGKCGRMDLACRVFSQMRERNVSSWTSMIVGYAMHGHVNEAIECFHCMLQDGVRPNHVTFIGVLTACVHRGKVQEGRHYFEMMRNVYGIIPQLQHYGCLVDLLGRVGLLEEARETVEGMPMKPNVVVWGCLLGACEKFGDVKMGEWAAKHLLELEPWNDGVYVVLSNIYASKCLWEDVERMRVVMRQRKLAKVPGYSIATSSN